MYDDAVFVFSATYDCDKNILPVIIPEDFLLA
jgi:hypothetical protein